MAKQPFKVTLAGSNELRRAIRRVQKKAPEAVNAAIFLEGLAIFAASQEEVPVDTGRLRASGVVAPKGTVLKFRVIVGYGTDYALAVHERDDVSHTVGKARYLEDPFRAQLAGMLGRIAKNAERFMRQRRAPTPRRVGRGETRED